MEQLHVLQKFLEHTSCWSVSTFDNTSKRLNSFQILLQAESLVLWKGAF